MAFYLIPSEIDRDSNFFESFNDLPNNAFENINPKDISLENVVNNKGKRREPMKQLKP